MDESNSNSFVMGNTLGDASASASKDLERNDGRFLMNHSVKNFSWSGLTVTVKDRQTKTPRDLICDIGGDVQQGTCEVMIEWVLKWY
jgi:hypothetical protein